MSDRIEILGSSIWLYNYELGDNERLEKILSVWDKTKHRFKPIAYYYDATNKILGVPKGLDLYYVVNNFIKAPLFYPPCDAFDSVGRIMLKVQPRDDRQIEAIKFCCGIDPYSRNRNMSQISLNLNTGVGKTFITIYTFAFYSIKTMMITANIDWLSQWKEKILEYCLLQESDIYIISGSSSIYKLLNRVIDPDSIKFYLCSHATLTAWAKKNGWNAVRELFKYLKIGIKIYDEAHMYFESMCKIDIYTNCFKTYYLSATPMRSDHYQNQVYQKCFSTVPKISLFDKVNDPHTKYLAIIFSSHPNAFEYDSITNANQYGFSIINYINYLVNGRSELYFKLLHIVLLHCFEEMLPNEKILIYIGTNEAILTTYYWLRYYFHNIPVGIYTSLTSKEDKRQQLENTIILTTTKSAGVLLDIPNLKKTILLAEPFRSQVLARQVLGRTRDRDTELIELIDVGFDKLKYWYFDKRKNVYSIYATEMNEISYTEAELTQILHSLAQQDAERRERDKRLLTTIVDRVEKV